MLAGGARIARVGRAAVVQWRRRYDDFPAPVSGTGVQPEFDRAAVLAWLLAHGKTEMPTRTPAGALLMACPGGGTRTFRLDDPFLTLPEDASGEDGLSGLSTDDDADTLAPLTGTGSGGTLRCLAVPGGAWRCRMGGAGRGAGRGLGADGGGRPVRDSSLACRSAGVRPHRSRRAA
ncbi:hypothetical protein GCM10010493_84060 [Streptomyces lavendulae subsp. grasserius]